MQDGNKINKRINTHCSQQNQAGFTLIEIVLSVVIFAVVMLAAYSGLSSFLTLSESTKKANVRQQQVIAAINFIENDIRYIVDRTSRNSFGDFEPPVDTQGLRESGAVIAFTTLRPDFLYDDVALPQRVVWSVRDNRLVREHWFVIDQVSGSEKMQVGFLKGVRSMSVNLKEQDTNNRSTVNSARRLPNGTTLPDLPAAIEVKIEMEDGYKVSRIIEVISSNRS